MRLFLAFTACMFAGAAFANDGDKISLADVAQRALQESSLTSPDSKPFHLRATIAETGEPGSDYQAKIEEYWVSPSKWRRTIESPDFSQVLVVNGDAVYEKDDGDYLPHWLNEFLTALFDPLPMLKALNQSNAQIPNPHGPENSTTCADLPARVDRWVICFEGSHGLLASVFTKGYAAEFKDYKKFAGKFVARRIVSDPEPGTHLEAHIAELSELTQPDEQMFAVQQSTPPAERLSTVRMDEETFRSLVVGSTDIDWATVGEGLTTGGCAVYVSADRAGAVREAWPAGCDNAGLQDPLREAVKKWHLKPTISDGAPAQVEALLGFTFHATKDIAKALPDLSDAEVRDLAIETVEPSFPPGTAEKGTEIVINISVDETGKLAGAGPASDMPNALFFAVYNAVVKWKFKPYLKDGKPQYFHGQLSFRVK
jgi:hypothetical protein